MSNDPVVWGDAPPDFPATRGGLARPYDVDPAEAWAKVKGHYDARHATGVRDGLAKSHVHTSATKALLAALDAGEATAEGAAALMLMCSYWGYDNSGDIARWLVAAHGLGAATEAMLLATGWGRNGGRDDYYLFDSAQAAHFLRTWEVDRLGHDTANSLIAAALELRTADAAATDADHAAAAAAVKAAWPTLGEPGRVLAAIALPTEPFWRDAPMPAMVHDEPYYTRYAAWLMATAGDPELAAAHAGRIPDLKPEHAYATVDRLGADAVAPFEALIERGWTSTWTEALPFLRTPEALALIPRLESQAIKQVKLLEAHPVLAIRSLAQASTHPKHGGAARTLLAHLVRDEAATQDASKGLAPEAAAVLTEVTTPPGDPADALPSFLSDPPWAKAGKRAKPIVAALEVLERPPKAHHSEEDKAAALAQMKPAGQEAERMAKQVKRGGWYTRNLFSLAYISEAALAMEIYGSIEPNEWHIDSGNEWSARMIATNWGVDSLPFFERVADSDRVACLQGVQKLESTGLAPLAAYALLNLKTARASARSWLTSYPETAAVGLVPDALGKAKKPRAAAEQALRFLATDHEALVREVAGRYGPKATKAIDALLATDAYEQLPAKLPKVPAWFQPAALPRLRAKSTNKAFDDATTDAVGMCLALSDLESSYPGLDDVKELCTPDSLEDFALAVFRNWLAFGADSKASWGLYVLGWFGRDEAARVLAPLIRAWPGQSAAKRATVGLDVLRLIGTEVALMHIYSISVKVKYNSIKKRATQVVAALAADLGLTPAELGDRLVPDFDLSAHGTTTLDYGPRQFVVGFDEALKPVVRDLDGTRRKALPKPGKTDGEQAKAEQKRFKALSKDVRAIAKQQIERLELAMCTRRRWAADDFGAYFVKHPLIVHLTRRLVWGRYDGQELVQTFRIDESGQPVDDSDEPVALSGSIGLPHPVELGPNGWGDVFADYELLQPFPQLARATSAGPADVVVGGKATAPKLVFGLEKRGWKRGYASDGGGFYEHTKTLGAHTATVHYEGAVAMGYIDESETLTIHKLEVDDDAVLLSEAVSDVQALAGLS